MALRKSVFTYLLRTTGPNGESYGGFKWPLKKGAVVKAPDWSPRKACGNGLHGLLMGAGAGDLLDWSETAKWLVVKVRKSQVVAIDNEKVKVPCAEVVYAGDRGGAIELLLKLGADPEKMVCGQASASGYQGQASASGTRGQASASGYQGQASASGTRGQASASGQQGIAQARYRVRSGELGILIGLYFDGTRDRVLVGYAGEEGIKPKTWYEVVFTGSPRFVESADQSPPFGEKAA